MKRADQDATEVIISMARRRTGKPASHPDTIAAIQDIAAKLGHINPKVSVTPFGIAIYYERGINDQP